MFLRFLHNFTLFSMAFNLNSCLSIIYDKSHIFLTFALYS